MQVYENETVCGISRCIETGRCVRFQRRVSVNEQGRRRPAQNQPLRYYVLLARLLACEISYPGQVFSFSSRSFERFRFPCKTLT
jgi:hypothetical protein